MDAEVVQGLGIVRMTRETLFPLADLLRHEQCFLQREGELAGALVAGDAQ